MGGKYPRIEYVAPNTWRATLDFSLYDRLHELSLVERLANQMANATREELDRLALLHTLGNKKEEKTMTPKDMLTPGYVVKDRKGDFYMVLPTRHGSAFVAPNRSWEFVHSFDDQLKSTFDREKDIVAIYGPCETGMNAGDADAENRNLLWERKEAKKMTMAEIEEALGYPVEVVKG